MPSVPTNKTNHANHYRPGSNNVICDRTGFKMKVEDCRFEWNGLFVRRQSFEERHPQDTLKGFPDRQQPAVSRPDQEPTYLNNGDITPEDL